jgi:hypothetical protein
MTVKHVWDFQIRSESQLIIIQGEGVGIHAIHITLQSEVGPSILVGLPRDTRVALTSVGKREPTRILTFDRDHHTDGSDGGDE